MKLFNTLTRQKEDFVPLEPGKVRLYACGPTVYNLIHIGNSRPLVVFDTFRRYLEWRGYEVNFVQNFTDIDDKIINRAKDEGTDYKTVSEKYIEEFWTDSNGLGVREATVHPKATECVADIIELIEALIEKGHAYPAGGDVYFETASFSDYGKLSHTPLEDLLEGASNRVEAGGIKKNPADFALWKSSKEGEPYWESPWGKGRPGWHIECSAMNRRFLGDTIDVHCGGQDLIFPHHENEIAQSECATGKPFARYWMHNGFITVDNEKMSKSEGNFFTVRDVAAEFGYEPIRMTMLSCHYRSPLNYSIDVIKQSKAALARLYTCRDNLNFAISNAAADSNESDDGIIASLSQYKDKFIEAMEDDFNTAGAMSFVFDLVRDINANVIKDGASKNLLAAALGVFTELTGVLGLLYLSESKDAQPDDEVESLIAARQEARANKNWAEADRIRDLLASMGVTIEDTKQGARIVKG